MPMIGLGAVSVREVAASCNHTLILGTCGAVWSCAFERISQNSVTKLGLAA